jgi:S1-C subfamily serine protease
MDENQPTTKQIVVFAVVLSFIVSVIGTILTLGILQPLFGGEDSATPFFFNRPQILEKITERVEKVVGETKERIVRQEELIVKVVEEASPAVVSVVASKDVPVVEQFLIDPFGGDPFFKQFFGDDGPKIPQLRQKGTQKQEISAGTGFIVSAEGLILTNKHVVSDKEAEYTVLLNDERKMPAKILARDPVQDLAVLKIEGSDFPTLKLGDSDSVKIGQTAIAVGNALGEFRNTVSVGVISGLGRSIVAQGAPAGPEVLQELIQTDAAINPGNSGGPLLNIRGEVVGINTAVAKGAENVGFAILINKAKRDIENVKKHGRIIYPFMGVRYAIINKEFVEKEKLGRDYGAFLRSSEEEPAVILGSPADKAGLKNGDIILEINGERIDQDHTLASLIQKYQVGDEITLKVFREGKEFEVKLKLEERK